LGDVKERSFGVGGENKKPVARTIPIEKEGIKKTSQGENFGEMTRVYFPKDQAPEGETCPKGFNIEEGSRYSR